jgi:quinol monooxygenase YgiN
MIALTVEFIVKTGHIDAFREAVLTQAANSLSQEPGCRRFDVGVDPGRPERFCLYEIYADGEALAAHRETAHYGRFGRTTGGWVAQKTLVQWRLISPARP